MNARRYNVFVSSTYEDLKEERQSVIQALLETDCFPSGMEMFPASDEDQWEMIKSFIDISDYYIVVSAGRYGSISSTALVILRKSTTMPEKLASLL